MSLQDFFLMHLTSVRIFFSRLFALYCLLAQFFFFNLMPAWNFFSRYFSLHKLFFEFPPPGISNGPPLNFNLTSLAADKLTFDGRAGRIQKISSNHFNVKKYRTIFYMCPPSKKIMQLNNCYPAQ